MLTRRSIDNHILQLVWDLNYSGSSNPFGSVISERTWKQNSKTYRFGYQGSEIDSDIYSEGVSYTTELRILDTRLCKWLTVDPVTFAYQSPYISMDCNPIINIDTKGDRIVPATKEVKKDIKYLRKHSKEFNNKYKQWKKEYRGRTLKIEKVNRNENITDDNGDVIQPGTLNHSGPQKSHKSGHDYDKKTDWLYYTAIEGAHQGEYSVLNVTFTDDQSSYFYVSNGEDKIFNVNVSTRFTGVKVFSYWTLDYVKGAFYLEDIYETAKTGYIADINISSNSTPNILLTASINSQNLKRFYITYDDMGARDHDPPGRFIHYSLIGHSMPIVVKVPRDKNGNYDWSKIEYNYVPLSGEVPMNYTR